jgi:hypothetical protein
MTLAIIIIIALIAVAAIAAFWYVSNRNHTRQLRDQFGSEYDYQVARIGDRKKAESELDSRQKRVSRLDIRPLPDSQRREFTDRWRDVQSRFVDDPHTALGEAQTLVDQVMTARGYPVGEFDQRANDVSVDHPQVMAHYRSAYEIASSKDATDTEQQRQAMIHYRALFDELLTPEPVGARR